MARTQSDQIRELQLEVRALQERDEYRDRELTRFIDDMSETKRELAASRQDNAVLRQLVQDHIAQYQEWDRRRWALILALVGTVFTLASGLIVTLAKK